jgi:sigma-B regulation protein RsbU (phosphoserine phosphatase)
MTEATSLSASSVDYRELMKKVEQLVAVIERSDDIEATVHHVAGSIIAEFEEELGIYGGRLYKRRGEEYVLRATFGRAKPVQPGFRVPRSYPPLEACLLEGTVFLEARDERMDPALEERLGVREFAGVEVGGEEYMLAFDVASGHSREDLLLSLSIVRHAINQKMRQERLEGVFREARKIQTSILPRRLPTYEPFDLAGRTEPMDSVGGDFYDFIRISDKILGVGVADVSGHGLPAALQVRDIHMGLRMGLARDFKIVRTVERLNAIIHGSTLTSRFVALFYGELEPNGNFIFVNAGHVPPFHLRSDGGWRALTEGGIVLGPLANATYERGFVRLEPGDLLVLFTDGIVETQRSGDDEEFGEERLLEVARRHQGRGAAEIVAAIFSAVEAFGGGGPPGDDRTVVVVTYPERAAGE